LFEDIRFIEKLNFNRIFEFIDYFHALAEYESLVEYFQRHFRKRTTYKKVQKLRKRALSDEENMENYKNIVPILKNDLRISQIKILFSL